MNANRWRKGGAIALYLGAFAALAGSPARGDVREAARRALPATVGVEWKKGAEAKAPADPAAVAPRPGGEQDAPIATFNTALLEAVPDQFGMASGTIITADGLIVTMIGPHEGGTYSVTLGDGRVLAARLLADDRRSGLQLLKVDADGLPNLDSSDRSPDLGEEVVWTYCLDLRERAVGRGIVAAKGRDLNGPGSDLLQIDAVAPAMSAGSPVVDEQGRLLGIVAFNKEGQSQQASFAVPASAIGALLDGRKRGGPEPVVIRRGVLGVYLTPNEKDGNKVIAHPVPDSPATAAGLREGDEILAVDGQKVDSLKALGRLIRQHSAGQRVKIAIGRDGQGREIGAELAPAPAEEKQPPRLATVRPEAVYLLNAEAGLRAPQDQPPPETLESLRRLYNQVYKTAQDGAQPRQPGVPLPPSPTAIRIQRSDADKKLEQIGRDVQSLHQQMEKLTEELRRLREQAASEAKTPNP